MQSSTGRAASEYESGCNNIKDSGNRRDFSTGAVRDISFGKGRFDLMPLEIVAGIPTLESDYQRILISLSAFLLSHSVNDLYAALTIYNPSYDDILNLAKHYENGALKYGEFNWQKGIPAKSYIDSAVRHLTKHYAHQHDEPHDIAFLWNIISCIWTVINKPQVAFNET